MNNAGSYLAMEKFSTSDTVEVMLEKIKNMFEVNQQFVNFHNEEDLEVEGINGKIYNSQLEEIFYAKLKRQMSLLDIKNLIGDIGCALVDSNEDEYGDFNVVSMEEENQITVAISLVVYFV